MTMLPRPPSAALLRKLAYTQSAQYTHPPLFSLFRRASTPRTEAIDAQVPHQTDGSLMRGLDSRMAVVLERSPSLGEENAFPASPCTEYPLITSRQGRGHVLRCGSTLAGRCGWHTRAGIVLLCKQLKACQMEIQRDRTEFDFSPFFLRPPRDLPVLSRHG